MDLFKVKRDRLLLDVKIPFKSKSAYKIKQNYTARDNNKWLSLRGLVLDGLTAVTR